MASSLLSTITQTTSTAALPLESLSGHSKFDDLANDGIGGWPNKQNIKAIRELTFYTEPFIPRILGIEVRYDLKKGTHAPILHGLSTLTFKTLTIKPDELVTGIYGQVEKSTKTLASIAVILFDTKEGKATLNVFGKDSTTPDSGFAYGSFGNIIAFAGSTDNDTNRLVNLSFYKSGDTVDGVLLP